MILQGLVTVEGDDIGITGDILWVFAHGLCWCRGSCGVFGFTGEKRESIYII